MFNPHRRNSAVPTGGSVPLLFPVRVLFNLLLVGCLLLGAGWFRPGGAAVVAQALPANTSVPGEDGDEEPVDPDAGFNPQLREEVPLSVPLNIPDASAPGASSNAETTEETGAAAILGQEIAFPRLASAWDAGTTVNVAALAEQFGEWLRVESNGDFAFTYLESPAGVSLRILPVEGTWPAVDPLYLELAWIMGGDSPVDVPAGQRVDLEVGARLYSPPEGVTLSIRERVGEVWGSSSVTMEEIQWSTYGLARAIDSTAETVEIAVRWLPQLENAWLEIQLPRVIVGQDGMVALPMWPTDTPTPVATPTPEATPTPAVTATPTPAPIEEATPTPLPADIESETAPVDSDEAEEGSLLHTPTPELIIVTSTPTPVDVFEEATRVAQATAWAPVLGTATPVPDNVVTPTPSPTPFVIVVTNTPVPENAATATYVARLATAIAFTTGTPTPLPPEATVQVATNTPVPQPQPTNTPTPLFVYLDQLPPTPTPRPTVTFPVELQGKIMFLSDFQTTPSQPNVLIMNPDGSELAIMGTRLFYNRAVAREQFSADNRFQVFVQREGTDANGRWLQIKFDDNHYDARAIAMTFFDNGHAWSPVWSPTRQSVAFVSNNTGNDEIFLVNINEWPPIQLTNNDWEWDHHPSFSPDGGQIVFSSNRNTGTRQLWIMDASGGNQRQLTNFPFEVWNPVWVKYPDS